MNLLMKKCACCALAISALCQAQLLAAPSHVLANEKIRITLSEAGKLDSVENLLAGETYSTSADAFMLDTDLGVFSNSNTQPARVTTNRERLVFHYEFGAGRTHGAGTISADLIYTLADNNGFFRRALSVSNAAPLRVKNLVFGATTFSRPARETVHYVTFIAAPTVEFIRYNKGGLFTGIENPYFKADFSEQGVSLSFEPALILKAGEGYTSEPQFMGVYKKSGIMIEDSGREFRYNANGSGYKPLDRNETRAMRAFALDYLAPAQKQFLNINYQFFHPLPQMPRTEKDKDYFTKTLDTFAAIGGDMIIFKPLHPYTKPDATKSFWDVVPDDPNHPARQICDYARSKGISYGFYLGIAGGHGLEGDSGGLSFRPDKQEWKKSDAAGRRAPDNCLACDAFFEWWLAVQNNTLQKYHLSNWSWDPSLGSGMNCYAESHGHIAGKGGYKGWRRCIELMGRLKAANPGLFIQGFYGTKNFGLWGLKNVDQHEVLNEQSIIVSTRHNQISDDRQNADGLRYQNILSMRYRFSPAVMGHSLTHRVSEGNFDPELIKAWDYYGWQYGVMSSLAISGSIMPTILPYEADMVPGYVEFYKKWQRWAKDNFAYVNTTEPFGEQVQPGAVDGYARIKGDHGFIFLFNGNPRSSVITFEVGDEINLQAQGDYQFAELYPSEKEKRVCDDNGKSVFALGDKTSMTVPANSCQLLELRRAVRPTQPLLAGLAGEVTFAKGRLAIAGVAGKAGETARACVRLPDPKSVKAVTVNGVEQKFTRTEREVCLEVQFAGAKYVRELDAWIQADGKPFVFPYHAAQPELKLTTTFTLEADVRQLLEKAKPKNFAEMDAKIAGWQTPESKGNASYSYHNFICERPSRLWLIIPCLTPTRVEVTLNGEKVEPLRWDDPSSSAFADLTDRVKYGGENCVTLSLKGMAPNQFMGPFLLYPAEAATDRVLPTPGSTDRPIRYTRALVPAPQPRYRQGEGPKVIEAKMMDHVTLREAAELRVKLDLPPEKIRRVMFFESGFGWMGQHGLAYKNGTYTVIHRVTITDDTPVANSGTTDYPLANLRVQAGDVLAHWGLGNQPIPLDCCGSGPGDVQISNLASADFDVGNTFTFAPFPQARSYYWNVTLGEPAPLSGEVIGNSLTGIPNTPGGDTGSVLIVDGFHNPAITPDFTIPAGGGVLTKATLLNDSDSNPESVDLLVLRPSAKEAQSWTGTVTPGNRAWIQENEYIYVWAEGTNGLRSEYYPVKVGWDFTANSRNAKVVTGAIEAESLKVQSKSRGRVEPQDMASYGSHWSGDSQMVWWGGLEQADRLVLEVPLEKAGVYALALHLSKAEDYGIFSLQLDEGPETEAMDLFQPRLEPPTIIKLKPMTLAQGKHYLRIIYHGKNPQSRNSLIGIDCIEFKEEVR